MAEAVFEYVHVVACPNCDEDLINTGDVTFDNNHLRYYDCAGCRTKVSVLVPVRPEPTRPDAKG